MNWLLASALLAAQDLPHRSLPAHAQETTQVRGTADGKLLLTTGIPERTVKVWLLATGKVLHTLGERTECFSLRPDGGLAALGEYTQTTVWNLTTGQKIQALESGRTVALGWSPDGKALTTIGLKGEKGKAGVLEARIWDLASGASSKPVLVPLSKVPASLAVSPSGTHLAVPHWEGGLRTWDLVKDRVDLQLPGSAVSQVVWSPDGRVLGLADAGALRFIEAAGGKELCQMIGKRAEFSPDGARVAVGVEGGIELWKTDPWTRLEGIYGGPGTGVWIPETFELGADGRSLVAGGILVAKDAPASGRLSGPVYFWKLRVR
jgi:WD40 repeat protein